jgi:hypothetical protein
VSASADASVDGAPVACANCGASLAGAFCAGCGQKRLSERERTLSHLLGEAFRQVTEIDGKLLRSLRLLLFRPGVLSREYVDGRRVRYAAPLSLFLLANVLYFFAPAISDFNLPFVDQVPGAIAAASLDPAAPDYAQQRARYGHFGGQVHSRWTAPLVARKLAARAAVEPGYDLRALARDYDAESGVVGKTLIIVHVPIIAFALALAYARRRRYFVDHFVVALHLFTFLLLFGQLVVASLNWLAGHVELALPRYVGGGIGLAMVATVFGYFLLACRNAYRTSWPGALLGLGAVLFGVLFANIVVYRALQFLVTLALA